MFIRGADFVLAYTVVDELNEASDSFSTWNNGCFMGLVDTTRFAPGCCAVS